MKRVSDILAVKNAASDVSICQHRGLVGKLDRVERLDKFEITGAVRLVDAFKFALHQRRDEDPVFSQFVLEPTDRQVASQGIVVVEISTDDRGFKVETQFHFVGM